MKKIILLVAAFSFGYLIYQFGGGLFRRIDFTDPTLEITSQLVGLGSDLNAIEFEVKDDGAGPSHITIIAQQKEKNIELFKQDIQGVLSKVKLKASLDINSHGFSEGPLSLVFKVKDDAFFSNEIEIFKEILVDFAKPQIQIVTQQHRAKEAGSEFVIYRVKDSNLKESGAIVGTRRFPAIKAVNLDPELHSESDLYGALLAIPFDFLATTQEKKIAIYAEDQVGNKSIITLDFPIDRFQQAEASPKLSEQFVNDKLDDMLSGYERRSGKKVLVDRTSKDGLAKAFRLINEDYRAVLEKILQDKMTKDPPTALQWSGIFIKPMPSATSSTLGEKRSYSLDGIDAGRSLHAGLDLASVENDSVRAANDGSVVLAEEFGIYGNAILIDHGVGVFTLYGHLSSISKKVGDKVLKSEEIGRSGRTGLAGGDHLHFEVRIRGVPVSPIEWWDSKWMQDDFYGKIAIAKVKN